MEIGKRIKSIRIDRGITQKDLADKIGVSSVSVSNWESGVKSPSMEAIIALSNTLSVSSDFLLNINIRYPNSIQFFDKSENELLKKYRGLDSYGKKAVLSICDIEYDRIQQLVGRTQHTCNISYNSPRQIVLFDSPSAAGFSAPLSGGESHRITAPDGCPVNADYAVRIQGNSMSPYIRDGEIVYIDKDAEMSSGDIGIFSVDGCTYCKQYFLDSENNLHLLSANPDLKDSNVFVSKESSSTVVCFGKVVLNKRIPLPSYFLSNNP